MRMCRLALLLLVAALPAVAVAGCAGCARQCCGCAPRLCACCVRAGAWRRAPRQAMAWQRALQLPVSRRLLGGLPCRSATAPVAAATAARSAAGGPRGARPRPRLRLPLLSPPPRGARQASSSSGSGLPPTGALPDELDPGPAGELFEVPEVAWGGGGDEQLASCFSTSEQYRSVVKVFCTSSGPNYLMPWQNKPHRDSTGSGFAVEGRRLVTNAHCVADSTHCQVRKHGEAVKFTAKVAAVSHECDLALLTVEDDAFWEGLEALPLGEIPQLQDAVTVVGYPTGGDNISVTGGVVSRVDFQQYHRLRCTCICSRSALRIDWALPVR
jgi:S1-C subfamily serine protease